MKSRSIAEHGVDVEPSGSRSSPRRVRGGRIPPPAYPTPRSGSAKCHDVDLTLYAGPDVGAVAGEA